MSASPSAWRSSMNKKIGNDFEAELCRILSSRGYWCHNFQQNAAGQPADIIAAKNRVTYLIDAKVCERGEFRLSRMEENQRLAMRLWNQTGNGTGYFALKLPDGTIFLFAVDFLLELEKIGRTVLDEAEIRRLGVPLEAMIL